MLAADLPLVVITSADATYLSYLPYLPGSELWRYRELLYFLTWRDIKVRYKQTILGLAWAVVQPLFIALTISIFFGRLAKMPSDGVPYPVFAYAGMVPWQLFAHAFTEASNSLVANERLITKVYFPRLLAPMSAVLGSLLDFAISLVILIPMLAWYRIAPTPALLALPFLVVLAVMVALGAGLWMAALNVKYRDVRYTVGFLVQVCFFLSPVAFPSSVIPQPWRVWYGLNPLVGVIEGFRWSLLGTGAVPVRLLLVSSAATVVILLGGLSYFRRMEDSFADVI